MTYSIKVCDLLKLGITLRQIAAQDPVSEKQVISSLLQSLVLEGRIVTVDALHTDKQVAKTIIEKKADYVMVAKGNQKQLFEEIKTLFEDESSNCSCAETFDKAHGRLEHRKIFVSSLLNDYCQWPGAQQVFCVVRSRTIIKSGQKSLEHIYGVTSLSSVLCSPAHLLNTNRQHWHIENKSHWIRDFIFNEDRSALSENISFVMATLRNLLINIFRFSSLDSFASTRRYFAAHPLEAIDLVTNF